MTAKQARYGQQVVVRRSKLFVFLPAAVLAVLGVIMAWDEVQTNLGKETASHWPWRLQALPVDTTGSLIIALGAAMLARAQFARSQRPLIGFTVLPCAETHVALGPDSWELRFFNGGPGIAKVVSVSHRLVLANATAVPDEPPWLTYEATVAAMAGIGMVYRRDYYLFRIGEGAPLPPVGRPGEGHLLFGIVTSRIPSLAVLDIRLHVADGVGDEHERVLQFLPHLPTSVRDAPAAPSVPERRGEEGAPALRVPDPASPA
jgi:hypothetical protein